MWIQPALALAVRLLGALARALPALLAYLAGRRARDRQALERLTEIQREQLRQANERPRDRRDLVERLRRDGL